jgi:hypothetical protein
MPLATNKLDLTGRLDDETIRVVEAVLYDTYPPTNPAVLLLAARNWYLVHGGGDVLRAFIEWMSQSLQVKQLEYSYYRNGQADFTEKTGIIHKEPAA